MTYMYKDPPISDQNILNMKDLQINGKKIGTILGPYIDALYAHFGEINQMVIKMLVSVIDNIKKRKKDIVFEVIGEDGINEKVDPGKFIGGLSLEDLLKAICAYRITFTIDPKERLFASVSNILKDLLEWSPPNLSWFFKKNQYTFNEFIRFSTNLTEIDLQVVMKMIIFLNKIGGTIYNGVVGSSEYINKFDPQEVKKYNNKLLKKEIEILKKKYNGEDLGIRIGKLRDRLNKNPKIAQKIPKGIFEENMKKLGFPESLKNFFRLYKNIVNDSSKRGINSEKKLQKLLEKNFPEIIAEHGLHTPNGELDVVIKGKSIECKTSYDGLRYAIATQQASLINDQYPCIAIYVRDLDCFFRVKRDENGITRIVEKINISELFSKNKTY